MNVLVTGGTGFVGREIVRQLHNTGHRVHLLARDPESRVTREIANRHGAKVRAGNVLDSTSLYGACPGMDAVIHLVGIIGEAGRQTFESVHVNGTKNMLRAAQSAGVKRFIQMSALGTRPNAVSRYHQSKWAAEEMVRNSGLDWTIFQPSIIYGPGDGFVNLFAKIIRWSPVVPIMGGGRTKFQPVAVETVAAAFVGALVEPQAVGRSFDLCGPETLTLDEIVDEILVLMKQGPSPRPSPRFGGERVTEGREKNSDESRKSFRFKLHVPIGAARGLAVLLELLYGTLMRKAPPLNRDQLIMLQEDNVGDAQPAVTLFGLQQRPFREGIARYVMRDA